MRARACSRSACAISWPITIAASSSVSFSWSRMPVKKAILPPGMQKALICLLPIRLTSQLPARARGRSSAVHAGSGARRSCAGAAAADGCRGASAPLACACASICAYCCAAACLELLGRHQAARARRPCRRPPAPAPARRGAAPASAAGSRARGHARRTAAGSSRAGTCGNNTDGHRPSTHVRQHRTHAASDRSPPPQPGAQTPQGLSRARHPAHARRWAFRPGCRCCWCWAR